MRLGSLNTNDDVPDVKSINVTPGSEISLSLGQQFMQFAEWTAGENETVSVEGEQLPGMRLLLLIHNDGLLGRTITFGSGFIASDNISALLNQSAQIEFVSNGEIFYELCRAEGM